MKFGAKLRELRKKRLLTQRELAEKVGIDVTYLSKVENSVMALSEQKILKVAEVLRLDKNETEELLLLAKKVPQDYKDMMIRNKSVHQFFRVVQDKNLDEQDWEKLIEYLKSMKPEK